MDNMAYLQQIASSTNPKPPAKNPFLNFPPKVLFFLGGAIILTIIIMILSSIFNGQPSNTAQNSLDTIVLRTSNLNSTLSKYNGHLKSSNLRSMATSLSSVLSETNTTATNIIKTDFGKKSSSSSKSLTTAESALISTLNTTLDNAKLNGLLDRTFVREISSQISNLIILETETIKKLKTPSSKESISSSLQNLQNLHTQFTNYSDKSN